MGEFIFDEYEKRKKESKRKELLERTVAVSKQVGRGFSSKFGEYANNYYKNTKTSPLNRSNPVLDLYNRENKKPIEVIRKKKKSKSNKRIIIIK